MRDDFAIFVLTNGRPDRVLTLRSLDHAGYTGRTYVVIDDEDPTGDEYRRRFGDAVLTFSKADVASRVDQADRSSDRRTILFARVAAFELARDLGLRYLMELDDDYLSFLYRTVDRFGQAHGTMIRRFDLVAEEMVRLLEATGALTVAMSQGGDHIGGSLSGTIRSGFKRKAMNSFVARVDRPIPFAGRLNEDVNAYALEGSRGELFLSPSILQLNQVATQQSIGGMTDAYRASGTYVKSFYTVMMCPSFVTIASMGRTDRRLHHRIDWDHAVPKIVGPELRRVEA